MHTLEEFVNSLSDEQFRLLWKFVAVGCTNTRELWLAMFLALQKRSIGPGNAQWAAGLLENKEKDSQ